jgi:hypothetical protein
LIEWIVISQTRKSLGRTDSGGNVKAISTRKSLPENAGAGHPSTNQTARMKTSTLILPALALIIAALAPPAFADTMSIPSKDDPAYTVDVPSDWKPKISDEALEATEPDNHVYVSGWIVTKGGTEELKSDIADLLKDSMKSIDGKPEETTAESNGIKFSVMKGSGVDKREGSKVKFMVAIFPAGPGKAGVFYADWDADAPAGIQEKLHGLLDSIKLKK